MKCLLILAFVLLSINCKTKLPAITQAYKTDQIQIDLANKIKPKRLSQNFESIGLKYLCQLDQEKNICVYQIDLKQKSLTEFVDFFNKEVGVESATKTLGCKQ